MTPPWARRVFLWGDSRSSPLAVEPTINSVDTQNPLGPKIELVLRRPVHDVEEP